MNQAASVTGRPPAGSTATASCCPGFNPYFMNTFAPQVPLIQPPSAQQCFLGSQPTQIQQLTSIQPPTNQQTPTVVSQRQQPTVSQQSAISAQTDRSAQQQRLQDHHNQSNNNTNSVNLTNISNNYGNPFTALSLQHLLANGNPSATNCVALATQLIASASLPHLQQLQNQSQLNHHQSSTSNASTNGAALTNQSTNNSTASVNQSPSNILAPTTSSNQVPLLNFNSYSSAPQNLNVHAPPNAQQDPPVTTHPSQSEVSHQQQNRQQQPNLIISNQNFGNASGITATSRPLATNTLLNNIENQQQHQSGSSYRRPPVAQQVLRPQQQTLPTPLSAQHLAQVSSRVASNDEPISTSLDEQRFQTMLLNQLIANNQFLPSLTQISMPQQQHQSTPQQLNGLPVTSATRSQTGLTNQVPVTRPQQVPPSFAPHQRLEQVSNQQQIQHQQLQQPTSQPAVRTSSQATTDNIQSSVNVPYQQPQQQPQQQLPHANSTPVIQPLSQSEPGVQTSTAVPSSQPGQTQQPPPQHSQAMPSIFYPSAQMDQVFSLLANPVIFNQFVASIYLQGLRSEQHTHQNPAHHFHHHLHGSHHHHHHHHGANGQGNGQDATIPVDSLAISESKPKGLNRAEIDSLTHYIHTDEKDSRTCVICLSKFELKSKIRPLSCNHAFHAKCVDKWLRANRTCPICRRDALKTYEGKIKRI